MDTGAPWREKKNGIAMKTPVWVRGSGTQRGQDCGRSGRAVGITVADAAEAADADG
jgi:hypothetical protein